MAGAVIAGVSLGLALYGAFGEGDSRSLDINQNLNNLVSSTNKQVVNLITQSIVDICHNIVQQQISTLSSNIDSQNQIDLTDIVVTAGSFTLDQTNNLKITVTAIMNIVQSNDLIISLTKNIKDNINMSLSQNADLSNQIAATNELLKSTKSSGELNTLVNKTKDLSESILGLARNTTDVTKIKNNVSNQVIIDNYTRANIEQYISEKINLDITQSTLNNCIQSNNALNQITLNKILVEDKGSLFEAVQGNILIAFYKCIISSLMKTQVLIDLSNDILNDATLTSSQGVDIDNESKIEIKKEDISSMTSFLDSLSSMIAIIIIIVIIYVTLKFLK
jgi:hypothetical protein